MIFQYYCLHANVNCAYALTVSALSLTNIITLKTYPDTLNSIKWLATGQLQGPVQEVRVSEILGSMVRRLTEQSLELVARPLQRVLDGIGEVLQGADGDALLRWVLRRAVGFSQEWDYNLREKVYLIYYF